MSKKSKSQTGTRNGAGVARPKKRTAMTEEVKDKLEVLKDRVIKVDKHVNASVSAVYKGKPLYTIKYNINYTL